MSGQAVFVDPVELNCDNMEARFVEFSQTVWHILRIGLNYVQPQLVRAASIAPLGFELRKLPASTYSWLKVCAEGSLACLLACLLS